MMMRHLAFRLGKLARVMAVPAWRRAFRQSRTAAGVEHAPVLRSLGEVRTVVDIGANRGQFSLVVRQCFPDATIVSFEPIEAAAGAYEALFAGDSKVRIVRAALGPDEGEATLYLSGREDSSSLLPISGEQSTLFPGTEEAGRISVRVTTLARELTEPIQGPALLKLDVQGFELQALIGCGQLLHRFAWVYVECSFRELYGGQAFADAVIAWLRDRDFVLRGVYNVTYDDAGRAVQGDFLFASRVGCAETAA